MSACEYLGKYALYLFNLLCLVSSVIIVTITLVLWQNDKKWDAFVKGDTVSAPLVLILIGAGVFIIAIIGICGILRDSRRLLVLFSVLLFVFVVSQLVSLYVIVYHMTDKINNYALKEMNETLPLYNTTNGETYTKMWNFVQSEVECCGVKGPQDWNRVTHSNKLPTSCCTAIPLNGFCTEIDSFKIGCYNKFLSHFQKNSVIIIWSSLIFNIVEVIAIVLALQHYRSIRKQYETV